MLKPGIPWLSGIITRHHFNQINVSGVVFCLDTYRYNQCCYMDVWCYKDGQNKEWKY